MSGYLHRLVTGAMRPARSIHPVVSSLYSGRGQELPQPEEPSVDSLARDEAEAAASTSPRIGTPDVPAEIQARTTGTIVNLRQPAEPTIPAQPRNLIGDAGEIRIPAHSGAAEQSSAKTPDKIAQERLVAEGPQRELGLRDEDRRDAPVTRDDGGAGEDYRPLLPAVVGENAAPIAPFTMQPPAAAPLSGAHSQARLAQRAGERADGRSSAPVSGTRSQARPAPRAGQRAEGRAPDEIQIHIGRIEVTAAPPPVAARPPSRPERKAVNLDEYLKRRQGRNR